MSSTGDKADPQPVKPVDNLWQEVKLAKEAKRFVDMANALKVYIEKNQKVPAAEMQDFFYGFKQAIDFRRKSWRELDVILQETGGDDSVLEVREKIEEELKSLCEDALRSIDILLPKAELPIHKVSYMRFKADNLRYIAEVTRDDERKTYIDKALKSYTEAYEFSKSNLNNAHPAHVGLMLNFSVFLHDILNAVDKAMEISKEALDKGSPMLVDLENSDDIDDSIAFFNSLRNNYNAWSMAMGGEIYQEAGSETDSSDEDNMEEDELDNMEEDELDNMEEDKQDNMEEDKQEPKDDN